MSFILTCSCILFAIAHIFCDAEDLYPARYEGLQIYEKSYPHLLDAVEQFLPEDPVIFEAGAHYGTDTVHFAKRWPKGTVISFEPNPHAFELLSRATKGLANVSIHNLAVNEYNGDALLHVCHGTTGDDPKFEGASSLLEASWWQEIHYRGPKVIVPCVVLDDWCEDNGVDHVDFIWFDLEGMELQVLRSSPRILDTVKVILTETNFKEFRKGMTQYNELKAFLEESRFKLIAHWYAQRFQGNALFVKKEPFEN